MALTDVIPVQMCFSALFTQYDISVIVYFKATMYVLVTVLLVLLVEAVVTLKLCSCSIHYFRQLFRGL